MKIIAKSENKEGLLPMKQGKEQEAKKTVDRKNIEVCNFIKNAFCLDNDVELVLSDEPITSKIFFRCNDSKRGKIWVAYGKSEHQEINNQQKQVKQVPCGDIGLSNNSSESKTSPDNVDSYSSEPSEVKE